MSDKICLSCCRAGGRRPNCKVCPLLAPTPRFRVVNDIIARAAQEHRLAQIAAERDFRADFPGHEDEIERARARYRAKCRRREHREKIQQAQEAA